MAAATSSAMTIPDWPPIRKPTPMNSAVRVASRMAVRK
jgi:hypothetical protein